MAETRPSGLSRTPAGTLVVPTFRSRDLAGYTVFRFLAEGPVLLHISCPNAPTWDTTCYQVLASSNTGLTGPAQLTAEAQAGAQVLAGIASLKPACRFHGVPVPVVHDAVCVIGTTDGTAFPAVTSEHLSQTCSIRAVNPTALKGNTSEWQYSRVDNVWYPVLALASTGMGGTLG